MLGAARLPHGCRELPGGEIGLVPSIPARLLWLVYAVIFPVAAAFAAAVAPRGLILLALALVLAVAVLWPPTRFAVPRGDPIVTLGPSGITDARQQLTVSWDEVDTIFYEETTYQAWTRRYLSLSLAESSTLPRRRLTFLERWATRKQKEGRSYLAGLQITVSGLALRKAELGRLLRRFYGGDLVGFGRELAPESATALTRGPEEPADKLALAYFRDAPTQTVEDILAADGGARAEQGSTSEARAYILSLLGAGGGTLTEIVDRSREDDGIGLEQDWARLNLDKLVELGQAALVDGRYKPT